MIANEEVLFFSLLGKDNKKRRLESLLFLLT